MTTVADIRDALEFLRQRADDWTNLIPSAKDGDELDDGTTVGQWRRLHAFLVALPTDGVILSREDAEFAAAWDAVEAHPGWRVERLVHAPEEAPLAPDWWRAAALTESHAPLCWAEGPTPTAALQALIEKLVQS